MTPSVTTRPLDSERDVRLVRDLLVATHPLVPAGWNWEVRRWDGTVFHNADPRWEAHVRGKVQLWEAAGALVGAVTTEGGGDAHLQLHPGFRHLEEEMVAWAEAHLARQVADGRLRPSSCSTTTPTARQCCRVAGRARRRRWGPPPTDGRGFAAAAPVLPACTSCARCADDLRTAAGWRTC